MNLSTWSQIKLSAVVGAVISFTAFQVQAQDPDRIQDIVEQARSLAEEARNTSTDFGVLRANREMRGTTTQFKNPFAMDSNLGGSRTNHPEVQVDSNRIQVNAGGRQFAIPRLSPSKDINRRVGVDPVMSLPTRAIPNQVNRALEKASVYRSFADSIRLFGEGEYELSLNQLNRTDTSSSPDSIQPFRSFYGLCLFANADYRSAAEQTYSALAAGQTMSWQQLCSYYVDCKRYAQHYQDLQLAAKRNSDDASLRFLLGFHHLVLGHHEHAKQEFEFVKSKLPEDRVVSRLLELAPPRPMD